MRGDGPHLQHLEGGKPMNAQEAIEIDGEDPVCRVSWWLECETREAFFRKAKKRLPALRARYGSAQVSTIPSGKEQSFMDGVKKARLTL